MALFAVQQSASHHPVSPLFFTTGTQMWGGMWGDFVLCLYPFLEAETEPCAKCLAPKVHTRHSVYPRSWFAISKPQAAIRTVIASIWKSTRQELSDGSCASSCMDAAATSASATSPTPVLQISAKLPESFAPLHATVENRSAAQARVHISVEALQAHTCSRLRRSAERRLSTPERYCSGWPE